MNSIILCEGFDDVFILGYYLFKTNKWIYEKNGRMSKLYDFPKVNFRNQVIEMYKKNTDSLAIWCVGGKDSFETAFKFLKNVNEQHPEDGIQKVFILTDRDNFEINDCLKKIEGMMRVSGIEIGKLENNKVNPFEFEVEKEWYRLDVVPIIIPFEEVGAIENVLMTAIEETDEEDKFIVAEAKKYIEGLVNCGKLKKYLQHDRMIGSVRLFL